MPAGDLMLSEMLSQLLVAYTIEYDNEFEHHVPNRTATQAIGDLRDSLRAIAGSLGSGFPLYLPVVGYADGMRSGDYREVMRGQSGPAPAPAELDLSALMSAVLLAFTLEYEAGSKRTIGLRGYPDGWRSRPPYLARTTAMLRGPAEALPRHPMVLHRGGYPRRQLSQTFASC